MAIIPAAIIANMVDPHATGKFLILRLKKREWPNNGNTPAITERNKQLLAKALATYLGKDMPR